MNNSPAAADEAPLPTTSADSNDPGLSSAASPTPVDESGPKAGGRLGDLLYRYAVLMVLVLMVIVYSLLMPHTFFTFSNLRVITATQAVLITATLGLVLPFATGEFDLSFGSMIAWSSTLLAVLITNNHWDLLPACVVVLGSCLVWGLLNALFIVGVGVSSLITTLGSGTIIAGLTLAVSSSQIIAGGTHVLTTATTGELLGLPYPVYFGFALTFVIWFVLEHTPIGRYMYFTGEGRPVARLAGLPVDRIRIGALASSSLLCGVAGIINFGQLGSADPNLGTTFLLPGTAAVFLGATVIKPGRFNAWGTVIAVYILVVGVTGLQLLGGAGWLEDIFNGGALILAVSFAQMASRRTNQ